MFTPAGGHTPGAQRRDVTFRGEADGTNEVIELHRFVQMDQRYVIVDGVGTEVGVNDDLVCVSDQAIL